MAELPVGYLPASYLPLNYLSFTLSQPLVDTDLFAAVPTVSVSRQSSVLQRSSDGFVHVLVSCSALADGAVVDPSIYTVSMAITQQDPQVGDWRAADWLKRTASPAGSYARVPVGPTIGLTLLPGYYRVYVRVVVGPDTIVLRAADVLLVE